MNPGQPVSHGERLFSIGMVAIAMLAGAYISYALLFHSALPLLGDYVEWTYQGVLLRNVLQHHPDAAYVLKSYPVPNSSTTLGLGLLMLFLPWQIAGKVWLMLGIALGLFCGLQLQRAAGVEQRWQLIVFTGGAVLGTAFWFGFENFLLGTFLAILLASMLLRNVSSSWKYGVLLVCAFFSHMIPFAFALTLLLLYCLQNACWRLLWQAVPSFVLTAGYFAGRLLHGNADAKAGMTDSVRYRSPMFAAFKVNSVLKNWGFLNPASGQHDSILLGLAGQGIFLLLFALNLIVAVVALVLLTRAALQAFKHRKRDRFVWASIGLFTAAGLLLPGALAGISDPGGRMLQLALWCGVLIVSAKKYSTQLAMSICATVLLVSNCILFTMVALRPAIEGSTSHSVPPHIRQFAHVYYAHAAADYNNLQQGQMDAPIYPTAMFLKSSELSEQSK